MSIGKNVKNIREQKGVERADLAKRARISYSYLSDLEVGRGEPSVKVLARLASALGVTLDEIVKEGD